MHVRRENVLALGACLLLSALPLLAAQNALIVIGMTGSSSITSDLVADAREIQDGLIKRGFAPDAVEILKPQSADDKITAGRVLESLKKRQALMPNDELWLILLGFAGRSTDGGHTFQVSGPRLAAADLKSALDAIPAQQFIFIGTSD